MISERGTTTRQEQRPGAGQTAHWGDRSAPGAPPAQRSLQGPKRPTHPAPASFGRAGISAGEDRFYKEWIDEEALYAGDDGWPDATARALGWFSLAMGASQVAAPGQLARWLGMDEKDVLVRLYGVREIGTGVAILAQRRSTNRSTWMWARVAGDVLDLATLRKGLRHDNPRRARVMGAMAAVGGVTALDFVTAAMLSDR